MVGLIVVGEQTLVTTGQVVLAGEINTNTYLDVQDITRKVIKQIGYTKGEYMFESNSCGVLSALHEQSKDINQGVDRGSKEEQGAGDQGIMIGFATNKTESFMPPTFDISRNPFVFYPSPHHSLPPSPSFTPSVSPPMVPYDNSPTSNIDSSNSSV